MHAKNLRMGSVICRDSVGVLPYRTNLQCIYVFLMYKAIFST